MPRTAKIDSEVGEEKQVSAKRVVDISSFFTKNNQEKGVYHEPVIDGQNLGIKFRIIGSESDEGASVFSEYDKDIEHIESIEDTAKKNEASRDSMARIASKLTKDMEPVEGVEAIINGKPLVYDKDIVYEIFYNSPTIANDIIRFSRRDSNFMVKKAN